MSDLILVERDGAVATVTLNRPEKLNAMTKPMWQALDRTMRKLSEDDSLRCVVLRGAGDKSFSPGNDIGEFETERSNTAQAREYGKLLHSALSAIKECRHPVVARISGICVGGGLEIAACTDIRICTASARFGAPINRLGLVMAHTELSALRALAGEANAMEILLEGRIYDASAAKEMGLVNRVVEDGQLDEEVSGTVQRIVDGAPLVHRWHKKFMRRLSDPKPLAAEELDEGFHCFDTEDFGIGYRAFLEKKKPEFKGR